MSASLVGSEMCIRDRLSQPHRPLDPAGSTTNACRRSATSATTSWTPSRAVSYTHLTLPTICSV
eukprot:13091056-Alexandrium_andersonii.AAC.1